MMKKWVIIFFLTCASVTTEAQVRIITTIAGNDTAGYRGDNGLAIYSELRKPEGLCLDKYGNIIIADAGNSRVRKITVSTGIITTIAGTDTAGYSGDNSLAINAELNLPQAVITDTIGDIYIADAANYRIRKINVITGVITTIAGNGVSGSIGNGIPATNAQLNGTSGLCFDKLGNLYIADYINYTIRKVVASTGIITTFAGNGTNGYSGDNGPATAAQITATQVFADTLNNVYLADQFNNVIRKIDAISGIITTIAGTGTAGYSGDNGLATNAQLNQPAGIYIDKQHNIFIAEYGNGTVRKIDAVTRIITTVAGTGTLGYSGDHMPATAATLQCTDVFLDNSGTMYIADFDNNAIRKVYDATGVASPRPSPKEREVWPNPVSNELNISNGAGSDFYAYDMVGRSVMLPAMSGTGTMTIKSDKEVVNVAQLPPGIYVVQIVSPSTGQRTVRKIVKE